MLAALKPGDDAAAEMTGIAPDAELIAIEAFGPPKRGPARSTSYDILRALERAYSDRAQVINMSFSGGRDRLILEALDVLADKDVLLIAAAGNEGPGAAPAYPGNHPRTIAATANDAQDAFSPRLIAAAMSPWPRPGCRSLHRGRAAPIWSTPTRRSPPPMRAARPR
jgi:subtilisin family serine protease